MFQLRSESQQCQVCGIDHSRQKEQQINKLGVLVWKEGTHDWSVMSGNENQNVKRKAGVLCIERTLQNFKQGPLFVFVL